MKRLNYLLAFALVFFSCNKIHDYIPLPATPGFNKVYGRWVDDRINAIVKTDDGGYITAGVTYYDREDDDTTKVSNLGPWVMKLDRQGNKLWQKILDASNKGTVSSITKSSNGGYLLAGYTFNQKVSGFHGIQAEAWVVKIDEEGNIIWQKAYGGSNYDIARSITATTDGHYVIAGATASNDGDASGNHGKTMDAWILKLDGSGKKIWHHTLGSIHDDFANAVTAGPDGSCVMAGYTGGNGGDVSGYHGFTDAWIVKLDNSGNKVWQKCLGGSNIDIANAITYTLDGGYVMAGQTGSNDGDVSGNHGGDHDAWVVKLDASGNKVWQKALGGSGVDVANAITKNSDGSYAIAGYTDSNDGDVSGYHKGIPHNTDAWIVALDCWGKKQWQKTLGGSNDDEGDAIVARLDGSYVVGGTTYSNDGDVKGNHGRSDAWIFTVKEK